MPQQIPDLKAKLEANGFQGDPKLFADLTGYPMGALVSLGGCSASFVSPDGLIVTNQHCVSAALQYNSTPARNLLVDGYLAQKGEDELWAGPGTRAFVTLSAKEVTNSITGNIDPKLDDRKRFELIERRTKERVKECEKDGLRCRVASFFAGYRYFEIAQLEVQDIRLVYTPPAGIGAFGGETDNWQWPRHTGDFGFYRAYVSKEKKSATFSKENVPYRPKYWLKVDPKGTEPGDLIFVTGYPGNTRRLETYAVIRRMAQWSLPRQLKRAEEQLAILAELSEGNPETKIKVATRVRRLSNGLTNNRGVLKGLVGSSLLAAKEAQGKALARWIGAGPDRLKDYGDVLTQLDALTAEEDRTRERDAALGALADGSSLLSSATTIYKKSLQRAKADLDRDPEYQERNWQRIHERSELLQKTLDLKVDRALFRYNMIEAAHLPEGARIAPFDRAAGIGPAMSEAEAARAIDHFLEQLYAGTKLSDQGIRLGLLDRPTPEVLATKDSFIELAVSLHPEKEEVEERGKKNAGLRSRLMSPYIRALVEWSGGLVPPDANGTLRVTFGKVEGVLERDGLVYLPQTTLAGIIEKNTGKDEFNAPKREIDAIAALRAGKKTPYLDPKLGDVPVNFLASVDTTGGNSGSPALNARGELIGLLFDGTFDTVASDIVFDPVRTRSILLDVRYMLWVMADVDGATNLLNEMNLRFEHPPGS